jgi:hypothetical protein
MWRSSDLPEVTSPSSDIWREVTFTTADLHFIRQPVVTFTVNGLRLTHIFYSPHTLALHNKVYSKSKKNMYVLWSTQTKCVIGRSVSSSTQARRSRLRAT